MIKSIKHKALRTYWEKGQEKGLNPQWVKKIRRILLALDAAESPTDMNYIGSYYHQLKGDNPPRYSVRVTGNYRITFAWERDYAVDVDLEDYH